MISRSIDQLTCQCRPLRCCQAYFRGTKDTMINLRILLLATTALTATQLATSASHAQTAPLVVAQARDGDAAPPGAKKEAPKGAPPPAAAPPRPAAPPPPPP